MRGLLFAVAVACVAVPAQGGDFCGFRQRCIGGHHNNYHAQKLLIVHDQPLYFAGTGLREESVAKHASEETLKGALPLFEKLLDEKLDEKLKLRFQGKGTFQIGGDGEIGGDVNAVDGISVEYPEGFGALLARKCFACHGDTPIGVGKGAREGYKNTLSLTKDIKDERIAALLFTRTYSADPDLRMPPDGNLTDDERELCFKASEVIQKQILSQKPKEE